MPPSGASDRLAGSDGDPQAITVAPELEVVRLEGLMLDCGDGDDRQAMEALRAQSAITVNWGRRSRPLLLENSAGFGPFTADPSEPMREVVCGQS